MELKVQKKPLVYGQLTFFDQGTKTIQWGKNALFSKWCWANYLYKRLHLDP